jgi:hypothetical protein
MILRPTLDGDPGSKFLLTNLISFEANWILELDLALDPKVASWFFKSWAVLWAFFSSKPIDFPSKTVPCRFSLNLSLVGLGPSSKGYGSNLWLSANSIALFHWILDLGPSSKVALSFVTNFWGSSIPKRDWINILRFSSPETNLGGWNAKLGTALLPYRFSWVEGNCFYKSTIFCNRRLYRYEGIQ